MDVISRSYKADRHIAYVLIGIAVVTIGYPALMFILIVTSDDEFSKTGAHLFFLISGTYMAWALSRHKKYVKCALSNVPVLEFNEETVCVHGRTHDWSELMWLRSKIGSDITMRYGKICAVEFLFSDGHSARVSSKNLTDAEDMERSLRVAYARYCEFHPNSEAADVIFKK